MLAMLVVQGAATRDPVHGQAHECSSREEQQVKACKREVQKTYAAERLLALPSAVLVPAAPDPPEVGAERKGVHHGAQCRQGTSHAHDVHGHQQRVCDADPHDAYFSFPVAKLV